MKETARKHEYPPLVYPQLESGRALRIVTNFATLQRSFRQCYPLSEKFAQTCDKVAAISIYCINFLINSTIEDMRHSAQKAGLSSAEQNRMVFAFLAQVNPQIKWQDYAEPKDILSLISKELAKKSPSNPPDNSEHYWAQMNFAIKNESYIKLLNDFECLTEQVNKLPKAAQNDNLYKFLKSLNANIKPLHFMQPDVLYKLAGEHASAMLTKQKQEMRDLATTIRLQLLIKLWNKVEPEVMFEHNPILGIKIREHIEQLLYANPDFRTKPICWINEQRNHRQDDSFMKAKPTPLTLSEFIDEQSKGSAKEWLLDTVQPKVKITEKTTASKQDFTKLNSEQMFGLKVTIRTILSKYLSSSIVYTNSLLMTDEMLTVFQAFVTEATLKSYKTTIHKICSTACCNIKSTQQQQSFLTAIKTNLMEFFTPLKPEWWVEIALATQSELLNTLTIMDAAEKAPTGNHKKPWCARVSCVKEEHKSNLGTTVTSFTSRVKLNKGAINLGK